MSISKSVIMGSVVRDPEKRFTTNNVPVTSFAIDISQNDQPSVIRVVTIGKLAENLADKVKKNSLVVVEGRLQTSMVKTSSGDERKVIEISAQAVEIVGKAEKSETEYTEEEFFNFDQDVSSEDLIGEDEIPF